MKTTSNWKTIHTSAFKNNIRLGINKLNRFSTFMLIAAILISLSSCEKTELKDFKMPPVESSSFTLTGRFKIQTVDILDSSIIKGAIVTGILKYGPENNIKSYPSITITDSTGKSCLYQYNSAKIFSIKAANENYLCTYLTDSAALSEKGGVIIIHMRPASYLKMHIKNIAPVSNTDQIRIYYPDSYSSDSTHKCLIPDLGAQTDSIIVVPTYDGNLSIKFTVVQNNIEKDSILTGVITHPRDTTYIELLY